MTRLKALLVALLLLSSGSAFAQQCGLLSTCPSASTPLSGSELLYIVQGGVSKKITTGLFLANLPNPLTIGTTQVIGGTPNYLLYVGGGGLASQTQRLLASQFPALTGDCTTAGGSLATSCTKTGGVSFAASATTDATNAANINSGILPAARLPAATSGTAGAVTYWPGHGRPFSPAARPRARRRTRNRSDHTSRSDDKSRFDSSSRPARSARRPAT